MKTAIEIAIEKFKHDSNLFIQSGSYTDAAAYDYVVEELTKLLKKEKEQIMNANIEGTEHGYRERTVFGLDARPYSKKRAEDYYNQTYNQNK